MHNYQKMASSGINFSFNISDSSIKEFFDGRAKVESAKRKTCMADVLLELINIYKSYGNPLYPVLNASLNSDSLGEIIKSLDGNINVEDISGKICDILNKGLKSSDVDKPESEKTETQESLVDKSTSLTKNISKITNLLGGDIKVKDLAGQTVKFFNGKLSVGDTKKMIPEILELISGLLTRDGTKCEVDNCQKEDKVSSGNPEDKLKDMICKCVCTKGTHCSEDFLTLWKEICDAEVANGSIENIIDRMEALLNKEISLISSYFANFKDEDSNKYLEVMAKCIGYVRASTEQADRLYDIISSVLDESDKEKFLDFYVIGLADN